MCVTLRIGINGFGRIGRQVLRIAEQREGIEVVAINDLMNKNSMAHLLRHDSSYGRFAGTVEVAEAGLVVNGRTITVTSMKDPAEIPWKDHGVDIVIEGTGRFTEAAKAAAHLSAGAKKVVISAPAKGEDLTIIMGVNHQQYNPAQHNIVSNASCTTNCLAPVAKVLNDTFGIVRGMMTTIHSYTNDQRILDQDHQDLRRARAGAVSMIPTTTGAAKAIGLVLPELNGKLNGFSLRVPTPVVSVVDLVAELPEAVTAEQVNDALRQAAAGDLQGILDVSDEPLVSVDYLQDPHSSIVDSLMTMVVGEKLVKVVAWYDNEWGYSNRLVDLCLYMAERGC
jgi:glyceraldehyde 3-phosphate dehydrogenase